VNGLQRDRTGHIGVSDAQRQQQANWKCMLISSLAAIQEGDQV
jgi:hypothetical protein